MLKSNEKKKMKSESGSLVTHKKYSLVHSKLKNAFWSGLAGAVGRVFAHPIDTIRTRLMATTGDKLYSSTARGMSEVMKKEGVRGLYRGFGISEPAQDY